MGRLGALYLAAHAITSFAGLQVLTSAESVAASPTDADQDDEDDEDDKSTPARASDRGNEKGRGALVERLTRYNAFCPTCVPAVDPEGSTDTPLVVGGGGLLDPSEVQSQLPLTLVATMEAEAPGISLATIAQNEGGAGLYAEGELVMDNVEVFAIDAGIVHLRNAGRLEYLQLGKGQPKPKPPRPGEKGKDKGKDKKKRKSKNELPGANDAIKCNGLSCTVERAFVNELLMNPAMLTTQGMARPYSKDSLKGFRLSKVRKGTVPKLLGLRTGDVITNINGQPMDSLDSAMKAYQRFRSATHLTIDITRAVKGERKSMQLDISII